MAPYKIIGIVKYNNASASVPAYWTAKI